MDESGKATLKSAMNLVKPLYLQYMDALLTETAEELLGEFKMPENYSSIALYYYMNKMNPGIERRSFFEKLMKYSKQKENHELVF